MPSETKERTDPLAPLPRIPVGVREAGRRLLASPLADALTTPHGVDRYLELLRPVWTLTDARAEVVGVRHQTPRSVTLELRPNRAWAGVVPGQFVRLGVEIDGVRHERCYSPAGTGSDPTVEVTVGVHPHGRVSTHLKEHARPGMTVSLSDPEGDFRLPAEPPERLVLIAGGTGITPLMAMLRSLVAAGHRGEIGLLHYNRSPEDAVYREEIERLAALHPGLRVARSYTRSPGAGELEGHFRPSHLDAVSHEWGAAQAFACGPPELLESVRGLWEASGLEERLRVESFVPPPFAAPADDNAGEVRFIGSGTAVQGDGRPLLEQAEAAGLRPEFGCRMGICHSCTCRKRSGAVRDLITGELRTAPDEEVQICISAPVGDVELEL